MTQTIEETSNGHETRLANSRQKQQIAVIDDSPFANLLDTGRFEHLWRVAMLFSQSELVPTIFRNKPTDCFVAIQMSLRLGVDPFMFLQNTYPGPGGKPGMEGKLAIALINTSGLFKEPLQYCLEGTGDDRGCYAWAILKATGNVVKGPRVSIKTAKDEGWYSRNKKWQSVPDLMLQYRAGAWFGRLQCPERLMGMQTSEEMVDIGHHGDEPQTPTRGVGAVLAQLNQRLPAIEATVEPVEAKAVEVQTAESTEPAEVKTGESNTVEVKTGEVVEAKTITDQVKENQVHPFQDLHDSGRENWEKALVEKAKAKTPTISRRVASSALAKFAQSRGVAVEALTVDDLALAVNMAEENGIDMLNAVIKGV